MLNIVATLLTTVLLSAGSSQSTGMQAAVEYPSPLVREEQKVTVNGTPETWRLQWSASPGPECEPSDVSLTCPCMGFAYGEAGDLYLVQLRNGAETERLHLTELFSEAPSASDHPQALVQRWAPDYKKDFRLGQRDNFPMLVAKRNTVQLMRFGDYDHDGSATEFYLQTDTAPCGKSIGVVIGVTKRNPKLHVFGFASHPEKRMYLDKREWDALNQASSGPVRVTVLGCGDHGSGREIEDELNWSEAGIDGVRREYACSDEFERKSLVSEKPLSRP
ncbi:MAG TPA: hypothetical protein VGC88_02920 [Terriglobales bacterium]|jgi:hypothetical protein